MQIEQFKAKFIEEALGLINQLEDSLLNQENDFNNEENIQQIFRVMHTLKGVSSMYGFGHIGDIAHNLETIFDLIRENKRDFNETLLNITLKTVDHFRCLLNDENLKLEQNKINQNKLLQAISEQTSLDLPPVNIDTNQENTPVFELSKQTFYIVFYPNENLIFRGINTLRIFEELAELGEFRIINHSFKETTSQASDQYAWGIYLVTEKGLDAIEDVFMFVMDDCRILKVSDNNLFNHEEFIKNLDDISPNSDQNIPKQQEKIESIIENINAQSTVEVQIEPIITEPVKKEKNKNPDSSLATGNMASNTNYSDYNKNVTARISIDASKLDQLMYLVSELVITKSQLNLAVESKRYENLISISEKIDDLARSFRDNALSIRLVPVAEMVMPFKRMIRDLSKSLGKEVKFLTQGIETELDKNVIDRLAEPIMHILRNCVDHGIERPEQREANNKTPFGNIKFTSFYEGANVFIQIQDDGAGIDLQKIKNKGLEKGLITETDQLKDKEILDLLFVPGFSTADKVTEVSGRGVGMDVVRKTIEEVRGEVEINTELGLGTFFTIKLHQTLSIIDTLQFQVADSYYLIPVSDIELVEQEYHDILYKNQNRQVEIDGELIPFVSIRDLNNHGNDYPKKEKLVVINKNEKQIAIVVDKIIGEHQAVLKPLGEVFQNQEFISGASVLGDGTLALMLDTNKLVNNDIVKNQLNKNKLVQQNKNI